MAEHSKRSVEEDILEALAEFTDALENGDVIPDEWDRRIEEDSLAGRLDEAGRRADTDFEGGRCTPL